MCCCILHIGHHFKSHTHTTIIWMILVWEKMKNYLFVMCKSYILHNERRLIAFVGLCSVLLLFKRCLITVPIFGNVTLLNEIIKSNA